MNFDEDGFPTPEHLQRWAERLGYQHPDQMTPSDRLGIMWPLTVEYCEERGIPIPPHTKDRSKMPVVVHRGVKGEER